MIKGNINNNFFKAFFIVLGLLMFCGFMWIRFIRERLPKEIPFTFSIIGFFIVLYICLVYSLIILSLITRENSESPWKIFLKLTQNFLVTIIFTPLQILDQFIKSLPIIEYFYKQILMIISYKLDFFLVETYWYYCFFVLLPRCVLLTTFCIDVFQFHNLFYIYKVLPIGIFLILNRYLLYSLKHAKNALVDELECLIPEGKIEILYIHELYMQLWQDSKDNDYHHDDEDWDYDEQPPKIWVKLENFIKYKEEHPEYDIKDCLFWGNRYYYKCYCKKYGIPYTIPNKPNKTHHLTNFQRMHANKELRAKLKDIFQIMSLIQSYNKVNGHENIKELKIVIYSVYLICWLYILIVSIHTLDISYISYLWHKIFQPTMYLTLKTLVFIIFIQNLKNINWKIIYMQYHKLIYSSSIKYFTKHINK